MKATRVETSYEESEGEDGENENMALMDRSDTDSDSDSTEVRAPTQTEGTVKEKDFVNIPSGSRHELKNSGGTNPETVVFLTEVFEKFGVPIPTFEPYLHNVAINYYEIGGHHKDVFAEYDIAAEGRTVSLNKEVAAARHIVLVALITGLSQPTIPFIFSTTQLIPDPSPSTS
ncbi:hypothetical protein HAX54_029119 [Datura stramonium]|uniref:Uncharacterized protein n=1 Tax=Datura stramonium TaxID=4076 RepID=A0ABS8SA04_DATST|nr:hypothetical protein [Datura stramonium]